MTFPLPPDHPDAPKYWMNEQSGELRPAVERYLRREAMSPDQQMKDLMTWLYPSLLAVSLFNRKCEAKV